MAKEKELTPEEIEEKKRRELQKLVRRRIRSLKIRTLNKCKKIGLRAVRLQFDWLKDNPETELPYSELTHKQAVQAWSDGIEMFEEELKNQE